MSESLYRILVVLFLLSGACSQASARSFELSAPPDIDAAAGRELYQPLAELLTRETGVTFTYVHPGNWFAYQADMRAGRFALLLDDAHFAGWRIAFRDHAPLVRTREELKFVIVAMKEGRVYSKEDLVGQPVCAAPPPALGTLAFLGKYDGPFQVPQVLATPDPLDRVQNMIVGRCAGAVLTRRLYTGSKEIRGVAGQLKIVTETGAYPGLTLTAGPGVSVGLRRQLRTILLSRSGGNATRALRERLAGGSNFVEAATVDYTGLHEMLQDYPGFSD